MQTELEFILRRLKVEEIVICGIQYPNCIRATVFDGVALGFDVTLVSDATGAQSKEVAKANIFDMQNIGVKSIRTKIFYLTSKPLHHLHCLHIYFTTSLL